MKFKSFSLDIIDFIGIIIPGIIWAFLVYTLHILYPAILNNESLKIFEDIGKNFPDSNSAIGIFIFLFSSYVLGYILRLVPTEWLDRLTLPFASFGTRQKFPAVWKIESSKKLYPYDFLFSDQKEMLENELKKIPKFVGVSKYLKTFYILRRILLDCSPTLWENARRREAEIKFICSLFYLVVASVSLFLYRGNFAIATATALLIPFFLYTFRRRRYAEVSFIYSSSLVVLINKKFNTEEPNT